VAANQIRKTHFSGRFMNRQNIDEFVKESVLKESRSVGIDIRESANILSGEIQELYVDDVKAPIIPFKWYVRIRYIIKDAQSGEVRFDSVKEGRGDVDINIALKANIEELLGDQAFQKIVRKK
jgi:hypothetical protein